MFFASSADCALLRLAEPESNSATMSTAAHAAATPPSTEELDKLRAGIAVQAEAVKSLKASGAAKVWDLHGNSFGLVLPCCSGFAWCQLYIHHMVSRLRFAG